MHPSSLLHRARRTVVGNEGHLKEILSTICLGVVKTDKPPYHAVLLMRTHYLNTVLDFSLAPTLYIKTQNWSLPRSQGVGPLFDRRYVRIS
jgi:hypothetical protein